MASKELLNQIVALQSELATNTDATNSAKVLINSFVIQTNQAIASAADDAAAVASIKDVIAHFQANDTALAMAVTAGTSGVPMGGGPPTLPPVVAPIVPPTAPPAEVSGT